MNSASRTGCVIVLVFLLLIFGFIFRLAIYPLFVADKAVDTMYNVTSKTLNANNVIYNYEWFKDQYQAIESQRANLIITQDEYDLFINGLSADSNEWSKFQQQEEASLRNSLSASKKVLNQLIADYNAKSSMVNRSIFKEGLPDRLEEMAE